MDTTFAPGSGPLYSAIDWWVTRSLRDDVGAFSDRLVWAPEVLAELHRRLVGWQPIRGDTFDELWLRALEDAPDATIQLAGELLWAHLVFPNDVSGARKRELIAATLSLAAEPAVVPDDLDVVLDDGVATTGVAYKARRQSQLRFLLESAADLKRRDPAGRHRLLTDPWACKAWLAGRPSAGGQSQREALLHLLHPKTFEPIVSIRMKRRIVAAFAEHVPAYIDDLDEALIHVRGALERHHGHAFRFTDDEIRQRWRA